MTNQPVVPPAAPVVPKPEPTDSYYLQQIADHLKSIRSMMTFFVIITVIAIAINILF